MSKKERREAAMRAQNEQGRVPNGAESGLSTQDPSEQTEDGLLETNELPDFGVDLGDYPQQAMAEMLESIGSESGISMDEIHAEDALAEQLIQAAEADEIGIEDVDQDLLRKMFAPTAEQLEESGDEAGVEMAAVHGQTDEEPEPIEENEQAEAVPAVPTTVDLAAEIHKLKLQIDALQAAGPAKTLSGGPGSQARPTVVYKLLKKPVKWNDTPQVASIEMILFSQPKQELTEPELFDLLERGKQAGFLKTRQSAARVFQYYRNTLRKENVLGWQ